MKSNLLNDELTIYLVGEVNSGNAGDVEKEIDEIIEGQSFKKLILDLEKLDYISSAGLRVVLKLKQKWKNVELINAKLEVYDIFNMTGFTNMMVVRKAYKNIDVSGAELIGEGYFSYVYRIDKDTIIKVFKRAEKVEEVERELNLAKQAFVLGVPTAISFDIVKVNDKYGVRFEMLDSKSLRDCIRDDLDNLDKYLDSYADLLIKINTTESLDDQLPDSKKEWLKKLEVIKPNIEESVYKKCRALLETIPYATTFVHGDCHVKNIMCRDNELLLIDMDTLSYGHPIFELAAVYAPYKAFEEDDPGNCARFMGLSAEVTDRIYNGLLQRCVKNLDDAKKDKIKIVSYIHMLWWNRVNEPQNDKRFNGCKGRLLQLIDNYNDLIL